MIRHYLIETHSQRTTVVLTLPYEENTRRMFRAQLLLVVGFKWEEIEKMELDASSEEGLQQTMS